MIDGDSMANTRQNGITDVADLYTQERGARYYTQREKLRSAEAQYDRARLFQDLADKATVILVFGCRNGGLLADSITNISDYDPNAHIIAMMRNPINMVISLHGQRVFSEF